MMCKEVIQNNPQTLQKFCFYRISNGREKTLQEAGKGTWEGS